MTSPQPDLARLRIDRGAGRGSSGGGLGWLVALLLLALFAGYVSWREGWLPRQLLPEALQLEDARPLVSVARVQRSGDAPPPTGVAANGYVVARRRAALSTDIQGRLVAVLVEEGDRVEAGQLVARIDTRQLEASLANARGDLASQQALARKARLDFERFDNLVATGEVTVADRDGAQAALDEAEASLVALSARIDEIEVMLDKSSVYAPFAGVITAKDAEVGEVVAALGATGASSRGSVATLVDFASLEVQVELAQTALAAATEGAPATIYLDAWPNDPYPGRVRQIWPTANRQKATVEVRIVFERRDERILPEMGVRVVFGAKDAEPSGSGGSGEPQVRVPVRALLGEAGVRHVLMVVDGVLEQRAVDLAAEPEGGSARVASGLQGGELVVLDPSPALAGGQAVRVGTNP